jgi:glycosyltransferase involved in cell wall biosynthesis
MHICHVITRLIVGGAQENTLLTCEGLCARGHQVTLVSGPTTGPEGSLVARAKAGGYRFIEVPSLVRAVHPTRDLRARRELAAVYREIRPDVVHTHSSKAGILGRLAAFDARVPIVIHTVHGMSFNRTQPWPVRRTYRFLEWYVARRTHAIVSVADAMNAQLVAAGVCGREKLHTVYSGMDVSRFDPSLYDRAAVRRAWGVDDSHVVIGTCARLFRKKGYEQLIPIIAQVARRLPNAHFVWIGDGAQRAEYEAELTRLGVRDRVHLTGLVPPERVPELMSGFDVVAHASQWEGLPRVVVQGLLMSVPAVAFDIDGTPEVVLDGVTGRLLRLGDESGFAAAVLELAENAELRQRLGVAGRAHCLQRFDAAVMVDQLDGLYRRLSRDGKT